MKYKNFEDFLATLHAEVYQGIDDDMPEAFSDWLCDLQPDEWIDCGDKYALLNKP